MERISDILSALAADDHLRALRTGDPDGKWITYEGRRYVNMSSNDYLGLAADIELQQKFLAEQSSGTTFIMGSTASRLMTGNGSDYRFLEASLAKMYPGRECLVLGSGYLVNCGILPAITGKKDLILADKYVHASIIDGLRLCSCEWHRFNHNDMGHLRQLCEKYSGNYDNIWVVTESLFSMDGDVAPIKELAVLKKEFGLNLYLDEAHAFGVYGRQTGRGRDGAGIAAEVGVDKDIDVIVATFGKALASAGAFAVVSPELKELLVNRMRTLIFSTGLPPVSLRWTQMLLELLPQLESRRTHLGEMAQTLTGDPAATHIIPLMAPGNREAVQMAARFKDEGFWVTPIRYPTVPKGKERVRISLSAAIDNDDIERFVNIWNSIG